MKPRPIKIDGDVAYIPLTKGYTAIIDAKDSLLVDGRNWYAKLDLNRDGSVRAVYAAATIEKKQKTLHRHLMGDPDGLEVDHKDGDGLNNRRENLRTATDSQNIWNSKTSARSKTGIKGVYWDKKTQTWRAQIAFNNKRIALGRHKDISDAALAYELAAKQFHGEFARVS